MRILDLDDGGLTPGPCILSASRHILDAQRRPFRHQRAGRLGRDVGGRSPRGGGHGRGHESLHQWCRGQHGALADLRIDQFEREFG
ncbi:Uncharacterised protein [Mycobacteroides abscessus subsp. abscessus]|nr:Uncharacterised protein [Mycobacteroides abscessus subsp. abscessus]